jgi:hypothetical protein
MGEEEVGGEEEDYGRAREEDNQFDISLVRLLSSVVTRTDGSRYLGIWTWRRRRAQCKTIMLRTCVNNEALITR